MTIDRLYQTATPIAIHELLYTIGHLQLADESFIRKIFYYFYPYS